jgi:predicted nucleic acid-binding protein
MDIYVDATTLIALGQVEELELLCVFGADVLIPNPIHDEVTSEPAKTGLDAKLHSAQHDLFLTGKNAEYIEKAREVLDAEQDFGDVWLIADVLSHDAVNDAVAVVSDDRRVRTVARGLGATVTGTIGVVVRNVADGELTADEAKALVRRLDSHGLHMTGELREKAAELIDDAAEEIGE